uniref:F-box domain-containing protein n=1 Tax=Mycena chlorophos TaxID=658473 RepID=A0ABQ0LM30_MYCCL|nr:predicted protein [Mycena chlorophos]
MTLPNSPSATLRSQIAELEATLALQREEAEKAAFHHKRLINGTENQLAALHEQLASTTYPVETVPPEILSEIFRSYQRQNGCGNPFDNRSSPIPLTQVCRTWRRLALSMFELWTSLAIYLDGRLPPGPVLQRGVVDWFARAGKRDLEIMVMGDEGDDIDLADLQPLFVQFAPRLKMLSIEDSSADIIEEMNTWNLHFPVLLDAILYVGLGYDMHETNLELLHNAPKLDSLTLFNVTLQNEFLDVPEQWRKLTKLVLQGSVYTAECVGALKGLPALRVLEVTIGPNDPTWTQVPYLHPALEELEATFEEPEAANAAVFLRAFTFPCLRKLPRALPVSIADERVLSAFLQRSSPPLRELSLRGPSIETLRMFTEKCPGLSDLRIHRPRVQLVTHFFDSWESDPGFCAALEHVTFVLSNDALYTYPPSETAALASIELFVERTADAVNKRRALCGSQFCLRSLKVHCYLPRYLGFLFSEEKMRGLRKLRDEGLNIVFGSFKNPVF